MYRHAPTLGSGAPLVPAGEVPREIGCGAFCPVWLPQACTTRRNAGGAAPTIAGASRRQADPPPPAEPMSRTWKPFVRAHDGVSVVVTDGSG
ncbi:hypothetical protein FRAAL5926 [Frankia alni ACN14a]|uniref:Uncharacterized protein n=1 Tax=Frankia alni (strain DSM 45986 / CECT 9034 / ACN14a) TaxID=326424 RepID=Q0RDB9_FRAAA|nr:hypothetical protein FRAAL5926 [Frankia alni ACN14a]